MSAKSPNTDTLTVTFAQDEGLWTCRAGAAADDPAQGCGPTPLAALMDLVRNIGRDQSHRTDQGRILLR